MVRLAHVDGEAARPRRIVEHPGNIVERLMPINLRLARAEQVEVGAVEDEDYGHGRGV